jgi:hypothetical protein
VTLAIPVLIIVIGAVLLLGRRAPVVPLAVVAFIVGIYTGQTWVGHQVTVGLEALGRLIG